jgi:hypothetical protein
VSAITADELASFVHLAATRETLELISGLELNTEDASHVTHRLFAELLAFYQYLALVYTANVAEVDTAWLNDFGGQLTLAQVKVALGLVGSPASTWIDIPQVLASDEFQALVKAYMAGDTSISGLSNDEWDGLVNFTGRVAHSDNFMAMNELTLFCRLLQALGTRYGAANTLTTIALWQSHRESARQEEASLKDRFMQAFPGRIR